MPLLCIILKILIFDHVTYTKQKTGNGLLMKNLPILHYFKLLESGFRYLYSEKLSKFKIEDFV